MLEILRELKGSELQALLYIALHREEFSLREAGAELGVSASTMSRAITRLVELGYVISYGNFMYAVAPMIIHILDVAIEQRRAW